MTGWTLDNQNSARKNSMKLLLLLALLLLPGCAYKGDVYLYSPLGEGNAVDKTFDTDLEIPLIP